MNLDLHLLTIVDLITAEFVIDKRTGEMTLVRMVKNDSANKFYLRASFKILTCWRKGYLPKNEEWAS